MSYALQHRKTRYDLTPAEDQTALSHHEFIMSSSLTATLVRALSKGHHGDFILPETEEEFEQFFVSDVSAKRVKATLDEIRFNRSESLTRLLDAAERHDFLITIDHGFLNHNGGAISRAISPDEW